MELNQLCHVSIKGHVDIETILFSKIRLHVTVINSCGISSSRLFQNKETLLTVVCLCASWQLILGETDTSISAR